MGTKNGNGIGTTLNTVQTRKQTLRDFITKHQDVFDEFSRMADEFNLALAEHLKVLKEKKAESALFTMTIPHKYVLVKTVDEVKAALGDQFSEYVKTEYRPITGAIRHALEKNDSTKLKDLVAEIEDTPRHEGPKPINISAISE